jgi:hypothetical protein
MNGGERAISSVALLAISPEAFDEEEQMVRLDAELEPHYWDAELEPLFWPLLPLAARALCCVLVVERGFRIGERRMRNMVLSGTLGRRIRHLRRIVPVLSTWQSPSDQPTPYLRIHELLDKAERLAPESLVDVAPSPKAIADHTPVRWYTAVVAYEKADDLTRVFANELLRAQERKVLTDTQTREREARDEAATLRPLADYEASRRAKSGRRKKVTDEVYDEFHTDNPFVEQFPSVTRQDVHVAKHFDIGQTTARNLRLRRRLRTSPPR